MSKDSKERRENFIALGLNPYSQDENSVESLLSKIYNTKINVPSTCICIQNNALQLSRLAQNFVLDLLILVSNYPNFTL